jgi:hypothetical protein
METGCQTGKTHGVIKVIMVVRLSWFKCLSDNDNLTTMTTTTTTTTRQQRQPDNNDNYDNIINYKFLALWNLKNKHSG